MKKLLFFFPILIFLCAPLANADAKVRSAKLAIDIPAGLHKSVRLKNLPRNATVKVDIRSDGAVDISFLDQKNYEKYPKITRPLFQSQVIDTLSFTVKVPSTGHYYLIFDNASKIRPVNLDVVIHGASGADSLSL